MKGAFFSKTFRRQRLDVLQQQHASLFKGVVYDIGGRDRGKLNKVRRHVDQWIFVDIDASHNPDMVADVADLHEIESASADVVSASELFEHVERINEGLSECCRILKPGGTFVLSIPFLYRIHADPYDYQRWTETKWQVVLKSLGFEIQELTITGRFFSVLGDMGRAFARAVPSPFRYIVYLMFPLLRALTWLDKTRWVQQNPYLGSFHGGYFIVAVKKGA